VAYLPFFLRHGGSFLPLPGGGKTLGLCSNSYSFSHSFLHCCIIYKSVHFIFFVRESMQRGRNALYGNKTAPAMCLLPAFIWWATFSASFLLLVKTSHLILPPHKSLLLCHVMTSSPVSYACSLVPSLCKMWLCCCHTSMAHGGRRRGGVPPMPPPASL